MTRTILVGLVVLSGAVTPLQALPLIEFSPDPSTAGNWSYDGANRVMAFEQNVVVNRGVGSNSDALVGARVYIPSLLVTGSNGLYGMTPIGNSEIKITNETGAQVYMSGMLSHGYLNTIGTIGAGYSDFSTDITDVIVTPQGQALGSAALAILGLSAEPGEATLDFELALHGASSANYHSFAAMIDGGFSGNSGFSGAVSVPEPTTVAILGLGVLGLARRRNNKHRLI